MQIQTPLLSLFLTLVRSDTRQLYNKIGNVTLTANGHSYSTGAIESVQLVHYRNLTSEGAWLFSETADVILHTPLDAQNSDSEDEISELVVTGRFFYIFCSDKQANFHSGQPD